jgi:nucleoside-diphosphate-sugar epimerase
MRVVVIGGTGHVGTYLVPRLVAAGHEVVVFSRGQRGPYQPHAAWKGVRLVTGDRWAEEQAGSFGARVRTLQPDAVIDLICFEVASAQQIVEALRGQVQHFLHCGTIWVHGPSVEVPTTENQPRRPFGDYGIKKAAIEAYLLGQARGQGFPATIVHPGHIVGPGWAPLNPCGHFDPRVFTHLAQGEELALPNLGMETVHHVHADDVAALFMAALGSRSTALGESFHAVASTALTLRGYAESVAGWFGRVANLRYVPWEQWRAGVSAAVAQATWDHIAHSPNCSMAKARRLLGFQPRYSSLQAVYEALGWLIAHGEVDASPLGT